MELLPENIVDYNRLKIIFSILEYQYGIDTSENENLNLNENLKKGTEDEEEGEGGNDEEKKEEEEDIISISSSPKKRKLPFWLNSKKRNGCKIDEENYVYNTGATTTTTKRKNFKQIKINNSIFS